MAGCAGLARVTAKQREAGQFMIERHFGLPVDAIMAAAAIGTKLAEMGIVLCVARCTIDRQLKFARGTNMTCFAPRRGVLADEREASHRGVIEADDLPGNRVMTTFAIRAIAAFVDVVRNMATHAGDGRLGNLGRGLVTGCASGPAVGTAQWESNHRVMVETGLLPVARVVA